jgi:hypothetical protein
METKNGKFNLDGLFSTEEQWIKLVEAWQRDVAQDSDYGTIDCEFTNSVFAEL